MKAADLVRTLLKRSGRLHSVAQIMAVRAIVLASNLITGMISAAVLGPAGRGVQAAMMVGPQFIGSVSEFGLHASYIYNAKAEPNHEPDFLGCALILGLVTGLIGMAAGWMLTPFWLTKYDSETVHTARLMLAIVPVGVVMHILMGGLESRGEFRLANRLMLLASLLTLVSLGILATFDSLTPATAAASYLFSALPICIAMGWHVRRIIRPVGTLGKHFVRRLIHYGFRFYGVDVLGALGNYVDQLLVVLFLAPSSLGIYAVAVSASRVLNVIPTSVSTVLFPAVAARSPDEVIDIVGTAARITAVIAVIAAGGLALVGPFLLHTFYGARFDGAVAPFRWLLVDSIVSNLARILYQVFTAAGRPEIVTGIETVGVATSALSMVLLVPQYGTIGAALSLLIGSTARLLCVLAGVRFIMRLEVPRLVLSRSDVARIMAR